MASPALSRHIAARLWNTRKGLRFCAAPAASPTPRIVAFSSPQIPLQQLSEFYGGDASCTVGCNDARPYTWSMSVASFDGRISFGERENADSKHVALAHHRDAEATAGSTADWRCLSYCWTLADAVLGSAAILRAEPDIIWAPVDSDLVDRRAASGRPRIPLAVVATKIGDIPMEHPMIRRADVPCRIYTGTQGAARIHSAAAVAGCSSLEMHCNTEVVALQDLDTGFWHAMMRDLRLTHNIKRLNVSAGGRIIGDLARAKLIDEFCVTLSGQLIGDVSTCMAPRPGLFAPAGAGFTHDDNPRLRVLSIGLLGSYHLYLRSRIEYRH